MSRRLEILLHDRLVGHLSETPDGGTEFRLLDSYRDLVPRPVLGQKFEDDLERVHRSRRGQGLPDFFANLVPEGRLREVIEETAEIEAGDDLALLAFVGLDLPGAVEARLVDEEGSSFLPTETGALPPEETEPGEPREGLRFSLAGVQLKFSMLLREEKLTLPAKGQSGEWIVKFDTPSFPHLPENEFSMLTWAREAGFAVPECRLHDPDDIEGLPHRYCSRGTRVLAVQRYDRSPEGRIHQEDFAQVVGLPPAKKYEQITHEQMAQLVQRFLGEEAVEELVRRLAFVVASGNNDAHLKNWSVVYPDRIRARWSPLYDQVATIAWDSPSRELALKLAEVKEFHQIDLATFERFARKATIDRQRVLDDLRKTLARLHDTWQNIGSDLPLPGAHAKALREHWRSVPLLRATGPLA